MNQPNAKTPEINAKEFTTLRQFLRGYLHQDMKEEHATVQAAAAQFWRDADIDERVAITQEWNKLLDRFQGHPQAELNQALTKLGSAQSLEKEEIKQVSKIFKG